MEVLKVKIDVEKPGSGSRHESPIRLQLTKIKPLNLTKIRPFDSSLYLDIIRNLKGQIPLRWVVRGKQTNKW